MKTIQITLNESLLKRIDSASGTRNRSAFFRQAAEMLLKELNIRRLERKQQEGYKRYPVRSQEFSIAEIEQVWPI